MPAKIAGKPGFASNLGLPTKGVSCYDVVSRPIFVHPLPAPWAR